MSCFLFLGSDNGAAPAMPRHLPACRHRAALLRGGSAIQRHEVIDNCALSYSIVVLSGICTVLAEQGSLFIYS